MHNRQRGILYCVRMWFTGGKIFDKVFDDYKEARCFQQSMIKNIGVEDAHLWEL